MDELIRLQEQDGQKNLLHRRVYNYFALRGGGLKPFCIHGTRDDIKLPENFPVKLTEYLGVAGKGYFGVVRRYNTKNHGPIVVKSQKMSLNPVLEKIFVEKVAIGNRCTVLNLNKKWLKDSSSICKNEEHEDHCHKYFEIFQEFYLAEYVGSIGVGPKVHAFVIYIDRKDNTVQFDIYMKSLRMTLTEYIEEKTPKKISRAMAQKIEDGLRDRIMTLQEELKLVQMDIKPENVMLDDEYDPYLIDFGGGWAVQVDDTLSSVPFFLFALHGILRQQYFYFMDDFFNVNLEILFKNKHVSQIANHYFQDVLNMQNLSFLINNFTIIDYSHRKIHLEHGNYRLTMTPTNVIDVICSEITLDVKDDKWTATLENGVVKSIGIKTIPHTSYDPSPRRNEDEYERDSNEDSSSTEEDDDSESAIFFSATRLERESKRSQSSNEEDSDSESAIFFSATRPKRESKRSQSSTYKIDKKTKIEQDDEQARWCTIM